MHGLLGILPKHISFCHDDLLLSRRLIGVLLASKPLPNGTGRLCKKAHSAAGRDVRMPRDRDGRDAFDVRRRAQTHAASPAEHRAPRTGRSIAILLAVAARGEDEVEMKPGERPPASPPNDGQAT